MRKTVHVVTAIYAFIYAAAMLAVTATCIAYLAPNSTPLTAYFAKITATPQILSLAETDYTTFLTVYLAAVTLCAAVPAVTAIFCAAALLRRDKRALKIAATVIFLCAGTLSAAYMATCAGASFDVTVPAVTESILAVSLITPLLCTLSIAYCTPAAQRTLPAAAQKTESREAYGAEEERETSEERAGALAEEQSVDQQPHSVDQQPSAEECTAAQREEQCEPNAAERQDFAEQQAAEQQSEALDEKAELAADVLDEKAELTAEVLDEKAEEQSAPCSAEDTEDEVAPEQAQQTEDVTIAEDASTEDTSTEDTEQPEEQAATEAPQENAEQATWREVSQYVPQEQTVQGIAEEAYGSVQPISAATLKKIETLRLLLESKAITSEEYVRLVRSYIDAK